MTDAKGQKRAARPAIPAHLSALGRSEWLRLAPQAHTAGTLTAKTARAFGLLVELLATERAAAEIVGREGLVVRSAAGTAKPNPAARSLEIARSQIVPLLKQFGLLPAGSRRASKGNSEKSPPLKGRKSVWHGVLQ